MRHMMQSNCEHLAMSLTTYMCIRIECATTGSKTQQDDLGCVADVMYVMLQDLTYLDFHPRKRPSELKSCDKQVVMEALLSRDASQQIDIADHQVRLLGLVQAVPVVPHKSSGLM